MHDLTPLIGAEVRRLSFDYQVALLLVEGPANAERISAHLQIETPIRVEHDGVIDQCDPKDKQTHGAITRVLHLVVTEAVVDERDDLRVTFDDGTTLVVARDQQYESWNLTGDGVPQVDA